MKTRLKNLYKYLIENRKHELAGWHHAYQQFFSEVSKIRDRINSGDGLTQNDSDFLKQLIYDKDNGIASRGQSTLSYDNFLSFIKDKNFIAALENLIVSPNKDTYIAFEKVWSAQGKSNNPVLVNRIAAACTLDVSTTVDSGKFNQAFSWLIREQIISVYPADAPQDWFSKNVFLLELINEEFKAELDSKKTDQFYLNQFIWVLYENLSNPFNLKKQIVKYGSPGTGKTYQACQQTSLLFDIWKEEFAPNSELSHDGQIEIIQFHPSFSYEDFIEGLRPVLDDNGAAQLTLQNGVFKEFCRNAAKWEIDVSQLNLKKDWESITVKDLLPHKERLQGEHWQYLFDTPDQSKLLSNAIPPFFFIIDEINRAELSRVFGELMYCLEYRGLKGKVKTQYANLNTEQTGMLQSDLGYQFFVPTNLYLIGTMNTIDRSVESFDFALRRRFRWEEVMPDIRLLRYYLNQTCKAWVPLASNLEKLNAQISSEPLLGPDYEIGHAYLMNMKYSQNLTITEVRACIWDDCIRPLLQEYLRGTGKETDLDSFGKAFGV